MAKPCRRRTLRLGRRPTVQLQSTGTALSPSVSTPDPGGREEGRRKGGRGWEGEEGEGGGGRGGGRAGGERGGEGRGGRETDAEANIDSIGEIRCTLRHGISLSLY